MESRIRELVAKPGPDGHDRGAEWIAGAQEEAQVIGPSILSGARMAMAPCALELHRENRMEEEAVAAGGENPAWMARS